MQCYLAMVFTLGLTHPITQAIDLLNDQNAIFVSNIDERIWTVDLKDIDSQPSSFMFAENSYSKLYFSDNGIVSFINDAEDLLSLNMMGQYIAPLATDHKPVSIRYKQYSNSDPSIVDEVAKIVNEYNGDDTFRASDLTAVTWDTTSFTDSNLNQFQVVLTQNREKSLSYVLFLYNTLNIVGDVTVGISTGDDQNTVLAWSGSIHRPSCDPNISVQDFTARSQTECGTRAGVLVFPVHDEASLLTRDVCTSVPNSVCTPADTNTTVQSL